MNHNEEVLWVWLLESFGRLGSFTWGANQLDGTPYKPGHHADRVDVEWGAVLMGSKMDLEAYVRDLGWHMTTTVPLGLPRPSKHSSVSAAARWEFSRWGFSDFTVNQSGLGSGRPRAGGKPFKKR